MTANTTYARQSQKGQKDATLFFFSPENLLVAQQGRADNGLIIHFIAEAKARLMKDEDPEWHPRLDESIVPRLLSLEEVKDLIEDGGDFLVPWDR